MPTALTNYKHRIVLQHTDPKLNSLGWYQADFLDRIRQDVEEPYITKVKRIRTTAELLNIMNTNYHKPSDPVYNVDIRKQWSFQPQT